MSMLRSGRDTHIFRRVAQNRAALKARSTMRTILARMALWATAASFTSAFVGSPLPLRALISRSARSPRNCRVSAVGPRMMAADDDDEIKVYYASEVTEENQPTKLQEDFGDRPVPLNNPGQESQNYGPVDYDEFVDGEGFDGGDGQVGCVGDGSNAMETFDNSEVRTSKRREVKAKLAASTFVKESKSRQRVAWGTSSGYAEKLKEKGMVKVNLKGEDISKVRRQQFENWRNQQEVTSMQRARIQEMDVMTGAVDVEDAPKWKRGKDGYFDTITKGAHKVGDDDWTTYKAPEAQGKKDGTEWTEISLTGNEKIEATIQCVSKSGYPGHASIEVRNTVMTFEPYHCTFVGDTTGFSVNPAEGTLERRGGEATLLDVQYLGKGPGDNRIGTLVIETEEDKWVYKIEGAMQ